MTLYMNQGAAAKGMHLWIWMLQTYNANNLTTILHISRTNVQHAIIMVKKVSFERDYCLKVQNNQFS